MKKLFLSTKSDHLQQIFNTALITPSRYLCEEGPIAIDKKGGKYIDYLILSEQKTLLPDTDCLLEIYVNESEEENFTRCEDFYFYNGAFPITRIEKIIFKDIEKGKHMCSLTNMRTAYIPVRLIAQDASLISINHTPELKENRKNNLHDQIINFNRALGGMSILNSVAIAGKYNFSKKHLSLLGQFNSNIQAELKSADFLMDAPFEGIKSAQIREYYKKEGRITDADIIKAAKEFKEPTPQRDPIMKDLLVESMKGSSLILYYMATYRANDNDYGSRNAHELIMDQFQGVRPEYREAVAYFYGCYKGYKSFARSYSASRERGEISVKNKLESKLDYYTIESIFEKAFKIENADYTFIDEMLQTKGIKPLKMKGFWLKDEFIITGEKAPIESDNYLCELFKKFLKLFTQKKNESMNTENTISESLDKELVDPFLDTFKIKLDQIRTEVIADCKSQFEEEKQILCQKHQQEIEELNQEIGRLVINQNQLNDRINELKETGDEKLYDQQNKLEDYLFKRIDLDNNGKIDPAELCTYLIKVLNPEVFDEIDTNNDDVLQVTEIIDYIIEKEKLKLAEEATDSSNETSKKAKKSPSTKEPKKATKKKKDSKKEPLNTGLFNDNQDAPKEDDSTKSDAK